MRIAIPVAESTNTIAEDFSDAPLFAIYDVHDETRSVAYVGRQGLQDPGCANTPGFLREHKVEVVMAHGISTNAQNKLLEVGILAIKDSPILSPDALIAHLVSGTLQATPPDAAIHGAAGGCGSGGCGGCCGGSSQATAATCEPEPATAHGCGSHGGPNGCGHSCASHPKTSTTAESTR